jgi:hypothetical protein
MSPAVAILDWWKEAVTFGAGLLLGAMSGFVWPLLRERISDSKNRRVRAQRRAQVLKELDLIAAEVMAAVQTEPHGVQNKDKWVSRLKEFATQYDDVLGPIAGYVKRISYKIDDSTFDHSTPSYPPYCCDEVEEDLALLKLCILPIFAESLAWDSQRVENEEKQLLEKVWINFQEIDFLLPDQRRKDLEQWYTEWKAHKFKIGKKALAMAPYVNHERK